MKFVNKLVLAVVVLSFSSAFAAPLKWYSFQEGLEKAQQENKLILIDFYTDWCGWCKKMDSDTYTDAGIISLVESGFVPVKVNPEKDEMVTINGQTISVAELSQGSGVTGFPATVFYTPDMRIIDLISGYQDVDGFTGVLNFMKSGKYEEVGYQDYMLFTTLEEMNQEDPADPDINYLLGYFQLRVFNNPEEASTKFKAVLNNAEITEAYAGLSLAQSQLNNTADAQMYEEKAKAKGYSSEDEIDQKAVELARKVFSAQN